MHENIAFGQVERGTRQGGALRAPRHGHVLGLAQRRPAPRAGDPLDGAVRPGDHAGSEVRVPGPRNPWSSGGRRHAPARRPPRWAQLGRRSFSRSSLGELGRSSQPHHDVADEPARGREDARAADWHLVHYGSRAVGGCGLVMVEDTAGVAARAYKSSGAGFYEAPSRPRRWPGRELLSTRRVRPWACSWLTPDARPLADSHGDTGTLAASPATVWSWLEPRPWRRRRRTFSPWSLLSPRRPDSLWMGASMSSRCTQRMGICCTSFSPPDEFQRGRLRRRRRAPHAPAIGGGEHGAGTVAGRADRCSCVSLPATDRREGFESSRWWSALMLAGRRSRLDRHQRGYASTRRSSRRDRRGVRAREALVREDESPVASSGRPRSASPSARDARSEMICALDYGLL